MAAPTTTAQGEGTGTSVLDVHLVTPDREVWSGEATFVVARSASGDLGVLPGHEPVLSILGIGPVRIERAGQPDLVAAVDGGFLSVGTSGGATRVDVLAEHVVLQEDIDAASIGRHEDRAQELSASGDEHAARREWAKADVRRRLTAKH